MKKTLFALLLITGCSKNYNVIPYENGLNEVNYTHRNERKALIVSLEWADDYCSDRGKDFVVVDRNQAYEQGWLSRGADEHVKRGVALADAVGHLPVIGDEVANAIGGKTREKLLFRCIDHR